MGKHGSPSCTHAQVEGRNYKQQKIFFRNSAGQSINSCQKVAEQGRNEMIVEQAYQYVCEHYDVSVTAQKYLNVYRSILKKEKNAKHEDSSHSVVNGHRRNGKYGGGYRQCSVREP